MLCQGQAARDGDGGTCDRPRFAFARLGDQATDPERPQRDTDHLGQHPQAGLAARTGLRVDLLHLAAGMPMTSGSL